MNNVQYRIAQYRSGTRAVVMAEKTDDAGAWVVFGPDTREACERFLSAVKKEQSA